MSRRLQFTYLQDIEGVGDEFAEPGVGEYGNLYEEVGILWLVEWGDVTPKKHAVKYILKGEKMESKMSFLWVFSMALLVCLPGEVEADTIVVTLDVDGSYNGGDEVSFEIDLGTTLTKVHSARFVCEGSITAGVDYWGAPVSVKFESRLATETEYWFARSPLAGSSTWPEPEPFSCNELFSPAFGATWDFLLDGHATGIVFLYGPTGPISYPPQLNSCGTITSASIIIEATEVQASLVCYYVDAVDGNDLNDGLSWETAFATIQKGIDSAADGDTVIVADGTYTGDGNRDIDFLGKAITVRSANGPENCIIDPNGTAAEPHRGFYFSGEYYSESVVDGFTIMNGYADDGGGIYCSACAPTPTIRHCIIRNNTAQRGGGLFWGACDGGIIENCIVSDNTSDNGGGIYSSFSWPLAGEIWPLEIRNCVISGNTATEHGGGVDSYCWNDVDIINCLIEDNVSAYGGGLSFAWSDSSTLVNCTITGNTATENGGGVDCSYDSAINLANCISWDNVALVGFGWDIAIRVGEGFSAEVTVLYSDLMYGQLGVDVEEGCTLNWGSGNIDADPLFVDPNGPDGIVGTEDDNLRLSPGSPCINTGDPNYTPAPGETDIDGKPRVINDRIDMGAYEFQGVIYVDDDASGDPGPGDPDVSDPAENGTEDHPLDEIQEGIDVAQDGDTVIVNEGLYLGQYPAVAEEINFSGKNITLTSINPADPNKPVIRGAVQFDGTENSNCTLTGFRIQDLGFGAIYGNHTQATISHCIITGNGPCSATVIKDCDGIISNCLITDNTTIYLCGVYPVIFGCHGVIKNCTIANNASGISILDGAEATIENCIIYYNDESFTPQLSVGAGGTLNISYCNVQDSLGGISGAGTVNPGPGNIDADPRFAQLGYWQEDPFKLVEGDYHLKSEGWRWRGILAHGSYWIYDYVTSRCIDAANPGSPLLDEVMTVLPDDPENEWGENIRRNMGFYGGTAEASMPPYGWALLADLTNDGIVNLADFAWQAKDWLASGTEQPGDLNRDGIVDITDAAMVATDWLEVTTWAQ